MTPIRRQPAGRQTPLRRRGYSEAYSNPYSDPYMDSRRPARRPAGRADARGLGGFIMVGGVGSVSTRRENLAKGGRHSSLLQPVGISVATRSGSRAVHAGVVLGRRIDNQKPVSKSKASGTTEANRECSTPRCDRAVQAGAATVPGTRRALCARCAERWFGVSE